VVSERLPENALWAKPIALNRTWNQPSIEELIIRKPGRQEETRVALAEYRDFWVSLVPGFLMIGSFSDGECPACIDRSGSYDKELIEVEPSIPLDASMNARG
jgi:hypothetical protein